MRPRCSRIIAINTAATYARSLVSVGLALFSSRWILQALGATDFGLFHLVGSLIIFLALFNSVMAGSAARHFAFAIGKGDHEDVNRWFNTSLCIHLLMPIALIAIGWPLGEYAVRHWLIIPSDRFAVSILVFRISLCGAFFNMVSIPFVAMFSAQQKLTETALWSVLQAVMIFGLAWILTQITGNRLLFYAAGMVVIHSAIYLIIIARALMLFADCRICLRLGFDRHRLKDLVSFGAWSLFGNASSTLSNAGAAVLLNMNFGPEMNAAFGIARQVSVQADTLASSMLTALVPEITAREGRNEPSRVVALAHFASKAGCVLVLLFSIPLLVEMDYILQIWLATPPAHTAVFCRLILVAFILNRLTCGYMAAVSARGKIAAYQATVGGILLLSLPLAFLFFRLGFPHYSLVVAMVITAAAATFARVFWFRRLFTEPAKTWAVNVLMPCSFVAIIALLAGMLSRAVAPASFYRLMSSSLASIAVIIILTWFFLLRSAERRFFINSAKSLFTR